MQSWTKNKNIFTHFKRTTVNGSRRTGGIPIPIDCIVNSAQSQKLCCIIRKVGRAWIKTCNTNDVDIIWYPTQQYSAQIEYLNISFEIMTSQTKLDQAHYCQYREHFVVMFVGWKGKCLLGFHLITFPRIYLIKWLDIKCTADGGYRWHCYQTKLMKNFFLLAS